MTLEIDPTGDPVGAAPRAVPVLERGGAAVAGQLEIDSPKTVRTLILLELSLLSVPSGEAFFQQVGPAF